MLPLLLAALFLAAEPPAAEPVPLTVLSYNIWVGVSVAMKIRWSRGG